LRILSAAALLAAGAASQPAEAQTVVPCEGLIDLTMISEPWETYSRPYAEGAIRVFEAFIAPTMAAGAVIGVIHPIPGDPHPVRTCSAVLHSDPANPYFAEAAVSAATASYDPARGLTVRIPVRFPDLRQPVDAIEVTINQAAGTVSAR
jgi:hypothetical protein